MKPEKKRTTQENISGQYAQIFENIENFTLDESKYLVEKEVISSGLDLGVFSTLLNVAYRGKLKLKMLLPKILNNSVKEFHKHLNVFLLMI